ncbi:unnamed protein product, partial [marine sediment metagenome]
EEKSYVFIQIADGITGRFYVGVENIVTDLTIDNLEVYSYPHPFPFLSVSERKKLENRLTVLSNK